MASNFTKKKMLAMKELIGQIIEQRRVEDKHAMTDNQTHKTL